MRHICLVGRPLSARWGYRFLPGVAEIRLGHVTCTGTPCGETGHIWRHCPKAKSGGGSQCAKNHFESGRLTCFFCDGEGHRKVDCPERKAWLAKKGVNAAATGSAEDPCLCSVAIPGQLPRIYVDVSSAATKPSTRAWAVLDTGSTRTLISEQFATEHSIRVVASNSAPMMALDGSPLQVVGVSTVKLARTDGAVILPSIEVSTYVAGTLSVVSADVLIGNDVVTGSGGMSMLYAKDGALTGVTIGPSSTNIVCGAPHDLDAHPSSHAQVKQEGDNVRLSAADGEVVWDSTARRWTLTWQWKTGSPPPCPVGHGVGEYSRAKLTLDQERLFTAEVDKWVDESWLVPHDEDVHGPPGGVLPLIALVQEHKASTPVQPCLDYRCLNDILASQPGWSAPVCEDTL